MYHLIIAVLAISLTSLVVGGGVQFLNGGRGVSTDTTIRVVTAFRSMEMAVGSYRVSNGGVLPEVPDQSSAQSDSAPWRSQLAPYAVNGLDAPKNLAWSYGTAASGNYLCLSNANDVTISKSMQDGLVRSAALIGPNATLSKACGSTVSAVDWDGKVALTVLLKSGG